jgi:hypothetical protein
MHIAMHSGVWELVYKSWRAVSDLRSTRNPRVLKLPRNTPHRQYRRSLKTLTFQVRHVIPRNRVSCRRPELVISLAYEVFLSSSQGTFPWAVCGWESCGQPFWLNEQSFEEHLRSHHNMAGTAMGRCSWQGCSSSAEVSVDRSSPFVGVPDFCAGSEPETARVGHAPWPTLDLRAVLPSDLPVQAQPRSPREGMHCESDGAGALCALLASFRVSNRHEPARPPMRGSSYAHYLVLMAATWAKLSPEAM